MEHRAAVGIYRRQHRRYRSIINSSIMRYTTIIDITEIPAVIRSTAAFRLYVIMTLKCGYHDDDRDQLKLSIRMLADISGLTVSATRHAIGILIREKLIRRDGGIWYVTKWLEQLEPTKRKTTSKKATDGSTYDLGRQLDEQLEEWRRKAEAAVNACDNQELETWISELEDGRSIYHHRIILQAKDQNIRWLKQKLYERKEKK